MHVNTVGYLCPPLRISRVCNGAHLNGPCPSHTRALVAPLSFFTQRGSFPHGATGCRCAPQIASLKACASLSCGCGCPNKRMRACHADADQVDQAAADVCLAPCAAQERADNGPDEVSAWRTSIISWRPEQVCIHVHGRHACGAPGCMGVYGHDCAVMRGPASIRRSRAPLHLPRNILPTGKRVMEVREG